jgi:hypothetical protein
MIFLNMFLKILYDVCRRNDSEKHQTENGPPFNSGRKALECTGTPMLVAVAPLN